MTHQPFPGVLSPVVTPFAPSLAVQPEKLITQCRWLISQGVGLAVFGTNSEANSLSVAEKIGLLDALIEANIDPNWLMPGTGCCALPDSVQLTAHAVNQGCAGVLMLPPFYYKGVSDDGLFGSFSEVIERVGDSRLKVVLYHIPPVSGIGLSLELIERLLSRYPGTVAGIKDSSGDWANTSAMLERQWDGFQVYAGSESFLLNTLKAGGAGCISATANINPAAIATLHREHSSAGADDAQTALNRIRDIITQYPMIPALKTVVAEFTGDPHWSKVRPPLCELTQQQAKGLIQQLQSEGFAMPGIKHASQPNNS